MQPIWRSMREGQVCHPAFQLKKDWSSTNEKPTDWSLPASHPKRRHRQSGAQHTGNSCESLPMHFASYPLNGVFTFGAKFQISTMMDSKTLSFQETGTSQMLWNAHNGTFSRGFFDIVEDAFDNSMGCTVGDWDMDGKLTCYLRLYQSTENLNDFLELQ